MSDKRVVLPEPEGPIKEAYPPCSTSNVMPRRTSTSLPRRAYVWRRDSTCTAAGKGLLRLDAGGASPTVDHVGRVVTSHLGFAALAHLKFLPVLRFASEKLENREIYWTHGRSRKSSTSRTAVGGARDR